MDFVFLVHGLTVFSVLHLPYVWPAYAKDPFALEWYALPFFPFLLIFFAFGYFISRVVVSYTYVLRNLNIQVWCMPRLGFNVSSFNSGALFQVMSSNWPSIAGQANSLPRGSIGMLKYVCTLLCEPSSEPYLWLPRRMPAPDAHPPLTVKRC